MSKKPIGLQIAKDELVRFDKVLIKPHLLIGGLAVQRYIPTRDSKDIDLVCEHDIAMQLVRALYPFEIWDVRERHDDPYRLDFRITHRSEDRGEIIFSPKIIEREPYNFIDWNHLLEDGKAFKYQSDTLDNIVIPSCSDLAFTKLISFLERDTTLSSKRRQDLDDLAKLSNHEEFLPIAFISAIKRSKAYDYIASHFVMAADEEKIFKGSSIAILMDLFGRTQKPESERGLVSKPMSGASEQKHDMPLIVNEVIKIALKRGEKKPSPSSLRDLLIVVDVQRDFFQNGALAANEAESLIEPLNRVLHRAEESGLAIILTRDWHPENHKSFLDWGSHCVKETQGAEFHPDLQIPKNTLTVDIGVDNNVDGYSPFEDLRLPGFLASESIRTIYVVGIALEFCVLATCRDAVWFGKTVVAVEPLIRAADSDPTKREYVWELLTSMGVVRAQNVALVG